MVIADMYPSAKAEPEPYRALIYEWQSKQKVMASAEFPLGQEITKITFDPKGWTQVGTSGPNHWKVWRVQEGGFKQLQQF